MKNKANVGYWMSMMLAVFLIVPANVFAYGGGGGGSGGIGRGTGMGSRGPGVDPMPKMSGPYMRGPEGAPVMGAPGTGANPYDNMPQQKKPGVQWKDPKAPSPFLAQLVGGQISNKAKDKAYEMFLGTWPHLLAVVKTADGVYGVYDFTIKSLKQLEQTKKSYQKSGMGIVGSGLKGPEPSMAPAHHYTGGNIGSEMTGLPTNVFNL